MELYYGTKKINAKPMTRSEYNTLRGWIIPVDENPNDDGYLVEYVDSTPSNVEGFTGYVSWSPKDVFEQAYQPIASLSFGHALVALKEGKKVARSGWNGKGMFLFLVLGIYPEGTEIDYCPHIDMKIDYCPHIDMKTADNKVVPWLASQTDVLANDWTIVE